VGNLTGEELKKAMFNREPVTHRGITYTHISALTYRMGEIGTFLQVELVDRNKNAVVLAAPVEVKRAEEEIAS
jgi:hypothetical protein